MRVVKAAVLYMATVFGVGFVLGVIRVVLIEPVLGARSAELAEMPVMLLASFFLARLVIARFYFASRLLYVALGVIALILMVGAELCLVLVQGASVSDYIAQRDPVSGSAYVLALIMFAAMPVIVSSRR